MEGYVKEYMDELRQERHMSKNTLEAYNRDILEFQKFITNKGVISIDELSETDVASYIMELRDEGLSASTINRRMSSIRSYASFLQRRGILKSNPTEHIKPPKTEKKQVEYLTLEEVDSIINAPDDSVKGLRDRAIIEVLYGTGIRVTEITELKMHEINTRLGFMTLNGEHGKGRIIPLGGPCKRAIERYIIESRSKLIKMKVEKDRKKNPEAGGAYEGDLGYLFVNHHGEKLTRQGLWKIVQRYAEKAGISKNLTPQILRNSFAVHMVQNGADLKSIQELMGYEDASTAQAYLSVTKNKIKEVFDRTHPRA